MQTKHIQTLSHSTDGDKISLRGLIDQPARKTNVIFQNATALRMFTCLIYIA